MSDAVEYEPDVPVIDEAVDDVDFSTFKVVAFRGASFIVTHDAWIEDATARGGVGPTRVPGGITKGTPCFRFGDVRPYTYELEPAALLLQDGFSQLVDDLSLQFWNGEQAGEAVGKKIDDALPQPKSFFDLLAALLGVPKWVVITGTAFVGYGIGVQAGLLPPLHQVFEARHGKRS